MATLFIIRAMADGEVNRRIRQGHKTVVIMFQSASLTIKKL